MRALQILAALGFSVFCGVSAVAQTASSRQPSIQADVDTRYVSPKGTETRSTGRFYRDREGKIREDSGLGAVITDLKAGTVTILVAETKQARVMRIPASDRVLANANRPAHQVLEETVIDGRRIRKARTTGLQGQQVEFWTAIDLGVVTFARSEVGGTMLILRELKNLSTIEPDPLLFMIPSDYTVVEQEIVPRGNRPEPKIPQRSAPALGRGGRGGIR